MNSVRKILDGRYVVLDLIGQGGTGRIYLARDNKLNKKWAVKEITNSNSGLSGEINVLKKADHRNLPRIVDVIEHGKMTYIVMDYIDGITLKEYINRNGRVPKETAVRWAKEIVDAMSYLHELSPPIIYRDMKPENIMVKTDGTIVLIDFGTTKEYTERTCKQWEALGTREYAAPEQFGNRNGQEKYNTDARTDIYSFGVTLYCMLTGNKAGTIKEWKISLTSKASGLNQIISRCIDKNPGNRYQNSKELKNALENYKQLEEQCHTKKRNIYKSCMVIGAALFLVIIGAMAILAMRTYEIEQQYRKVMEEGNGYVFSGNVREAEKSYVRAITEIDGGKNEAYLRLLELYQKENKTREGAARISEYLDSNYKGIGKNPVLLFRTALIYFNELSEYEKAWEYFREVSAKTIEDADYYEGISKSLSSIEIDYKEVQESLLKFEIYNRSKTDLNDRFQNSINMAKLYLMYGEQIEMSYKKAAYILEEEVRVNDAVEDIEQMERVKESFGMLSTIYRLLGKKDTSNRKEYYEKSIAYIHKLFEVSDRKKEADLYVIKLCDMAQMYEDLGKTEEALSCYERCENEFKDGKETYIRHISLLLKKNMPDRLGKVYKQAIKVEGIKEDIRFQKLSERIRESKKERESIHGY